MLSDDITGAIGSVFGVIGRVIGGAIRGGILFGALAFATGAIIAAAPAMFEALESVFKTMALTRDSQFETFELIRNAIKAANGDV